MASTAFFRRVLVTSIATMVSFSALAADLNSLILPKAKQALTLDFVSVDELHFAFGEWGHILTSRNGLDWTQASTPTKTTLTRGYFVDAMNGWVVGHEASILHTVDGGKQWEIQHSWAHADRPLLDVTFLSAERGIAIGAYGLYLETQDGGNNWHQRFLTELLEPSDVDYLEEIREESEENYLVELNSMLPHFNAIAQVGSRLVMAGEMGLVAVSDDQGKSWAHLDAEYDGSFFAVTAINDHDFMVAGLRGKVLRYVDGAWLDYSFEQAITINNLVHVNDKIWAMGNAGHYFVLAPATGDYQHFQLERSPALLDVLFADGKPVMASSDGILIEPRLKAAK